MNTRMRLSVGVAAGVVGGATVAHELAALETDAALVAIGAFLLVFSIGVLKTGP